MLRDGKDIITAIYSALLKISFNESKVTMPSSHGESNVYSTCFSCVKMHSRTSFFVLMPSFKCTERLF